MAMACNHFFPVKQNFKVNATTSSIRLTASPAFGTQGNLVLNPGRIYVNNRQNSQKPPQLVLKVKGLKPGTTVYWTFKYRKGPNNINQIPRQAFLSSQIKHPYNQWDDSTITNQDGESEVLFTGTTYAGDSFQFGISLKEYRGGFKNEDKMSIRFRNSIKKTKSFVIWKKIFFEEPKILKNVRFPYNTWKLVKKNLEQLNIECVGLLNPIELNPADPSIYYYFYNQKKDPLRGKKKNARYGPGEYGPMEVMLSRLNTIYSDKNPKTINIFIFGAASKERDLIQNVSSSGDPVPQPVDYNHSYTRDEIDLSEWTAFGTGKSMGGPSPAIFIWSDFWWLGSKIIKTTHEKSLARVILHELGHYLLMFKRGGKEGILDKTGHLEMSLITKNSIMTGSSITRLNQKGQPYNSSAAMKLERRFINNPTWHPKIEMLIRRDYLPPEE